MIELQRKLIGDRVRNEAFSRALKAAIRPGMTVVDLGSGTGFLAFLASRLGAGHCTLIEYGDILETSRELAKRNGITNCTFLKKHSMDVKNLEKVDVLVSETLGNYALEENIVESVEDGKRFLRPGGIIIPGKVRQYVCPVTADRIQREIDVWDPGYDLDFLEAREISLNNMYVKTVRPDDLPASPDAVRLWDTVDFSKKNASIRDTEETWEHPVVLQLHGFVLWWEAELVPGIVLSTSPFSQPTHWEQIYLPLLQPVILGKGESVTLSLRSDTRLKVKVNLRWKVTVKNQAGEIRSSQQMDMRKGHID